MKIIELATLKINFHNAYELHIGVQADGTLCSYLQIPLDSQRLSDCHDYLKSIEFVPETAFGTVVWRRKREVSDLSAESFADVLLIITRFGARKQDKLNGNQLRESTE